MVFKDKINNFAVQILLNMTYKFNYGYCKAAPIMEWMSNKWGIVILLCIEESPDRCMRFSELFRNIPYVSDKMIATTLRYLEREGLVSRTEYKEMPPRVEYGLTPLSENFLCEVHRLMQWGQIHYDEIMAYRARYVAGHDS